MGRMTVRGSVVSQRDINRLLELSDENQFGANNAYYKLKHYEDLEEQGRLIELDKQHCDWCDKGAELCGTCRKFFDYHNDGGSDKCSAECKEGACLNYEPMNYCPNCGAKLKELKEGVE